MYQPCTSTTVNSGDQRGVTVTRKPVMTSTIVDLPGKGESFGPGLITRRSQVQILPPPPFGRPGNTAFPGLLHSPARMASTGLVYRRG